MSNETIITTVEERFDQERSSLSLADQFKGEKPMALAGKDRNIAAVTIARDRARILAEAVKGPNDQDAYNAAKEHHKLLKRMNGAVNDWKKKTKAEALKFTKLVDGYYNELADPIAEGKTIIEERLGEIDRILEEQEKKRKADEEARYAERYEVLVGKLGMEYNDLKREFTIEHAGASATITKETVMLADKKVLEQLVMEQIMPIVKAIKKAVKASSQEQEDERSKQKAAIQEVENARVLALQTVGMQLAGTKKLYLHELEVNIKELGTMPAEVFLDLMEAAEEAAKPVDQDNNTLEPLFSTEPPAATKPANTAKKEALVESSAHPVNPVPRMKAIVRELRELRPDLDSKHHRDINVVIATLEKIAVKLEQS